MTEEEMLVQEQFEDVLNTGDKEALSEFLNEQNISDVAELIDENEDREIDIFMSLSMHRATGVFKILDHPTQKRIIKNLPPTKSAELLNKMEPDDRTSFFEDLPNEVVRELVKTLVPEERKITLSLLGYPENSVGRLMTPDYVYVYEDNTVAEVLDIIRGVGKNTETIDVIYVIDKHGELLDDLRIREFILASPDTKVSEMMDGRFIELNVNDDQETANEVFKMNNRVALPVVDDNNVLLGIVTIDDVLWVTNEEFSEDIQKIGGAQALDTPYLETPIFTLVKKRVGWLVILFLGEMLTATAMAFFNDEMAQVIILTNFIPLIISTGGNSGTQASTLIIQAMALGEVSLRDWWRVMRREIMSGLMLGIILGIVGFCRIAIWSFLMNHHIITSYNYGPYWVLIGLTVCFSLVGVVLWSSLIGSMLPLLLKRLGADPASSSAPFVATLVDVTGLIIFFNVALWTLTGTLL
ncbi:magnesium transporter [Hanamia caeni]|jgi:magnesium transporter|uniref:Magnesium transporter MgtE n=1 Tax=Hanamia caeni TaxID=2294116 RepID=A0A3M9NQK3_9BACT|nr:magnesium transporter [Hanamia caeni]RNI40056.1 magnesium transporter [Hanamia caeni]